VSLPFRGRIHEQAAFSVWSQGEGCHGDVAQYRDDDDSGFHVRRPRSGTHGVTIEASHGSDVPLINRKEVIVVYEGHDRDEVAAWVPAEGTMQGSNFSSCSTMPGHQPQFTTGRSSPD
jgi:hypothetical protein